jgi:hypothetical protein
VTEPAPPSAERVALTKIARLVAVAMDNEPSRQHLKRDMRAAPFHEHKLQLTDYLGSKDGRALLESMARGVPGGEGEVFAALAAIRPLEFYMPVQKHRESWTGKADVLVVSQLDESGAVIAFDESGREVSLDRKLAPDQPTLTIVPVETAFDAPMVPSASRNARDQGGTTIGTLEPFTPKGSSLIACDESCSGGGSVGGGGGGVTVPPGLYLEFSRILDMKEPWFRGEPEIEVHIQGPNISTAPTNGEDLSCSGEHAHDYRKVFNQDGAFWEGKVMLFSSEEAVGFVNKFNQGFHVLFWEDDNEPCTLKLDTQILSSLLRSTATAAASAAIKLVPKVPPYVVVGVFIGTFFASAGDWLLTNDDFLGAAVDQTSAGYYYPGNTHVIMDGTTFNGRATIVYRQ